MGNIIGYAIYEEGGLSPDVSVINCSWFGDNRFQGFQFREATEDNKEFLDLFGVKVVPSYLFLEELPGGRYKNVGLIKGEPSRDQMCQVIDNILNGRTGWGGIINLIEVEGINGGYQNLPWITLPSLNLKWWPLILVGLVVFLNKK